MTPCHGVHLNPLHLGICFSAGKENSADSVHIYTLPEKLIRPPEYTFLRSPILVSLPFLSTSLHSVDSCGSFLTSLCTVKRIGALC